MRNRAMISMLVVSAALMLWTATPSNASNGDTGLGVDLDFYTGPISRDAWLEMKQAGLRYAVVQAWGGRSRNEFAVSQLSGARLTGGMRTAAYILLNFDDKVCPTFSHPVREGGGHCAGDLVSLQKRSARWQVRQGLAALGSELRYIAFIAIDVEWFLQTAPSTDAVAQSRRAQYILDAIDEVRNSRNKAVIYTRNSKRHWRDITGCDADSAIGACKTLTQVVNNPSRPIPLWDVQTGSPDLDNFQPYAHWAQRAGRQYQLDANLFGLPSSRTVDLNVFDASLFSVVASSGSSSPVSQVAARRFGQTKSPKWR